MNQRNSEKNRIRWHLYVLFPVIVCMFILSGCHRKNSVKENMTENAEEQTEEVEEVYYRVRETILPNPDTEIVKIAETTEEKRWVQEISFGMQGDTAYRLVRFSGSRITTGRGMYLQVIKPPYTEWKTYSVSTEYWNENPYENYEVKEIMVTQDNQVYMVVTNFIWDTKTDAYYLGLWNEDENGKILCEIPKSVMNKEESSYNDRITFFSEDDIYKYRIRGRKISKLTEDLQQEKEYVLPEGLWGLLRNPDSQVIYWYGIQKEKFGIWALEDGAPRLDVQEVFSEMGAYDNQFIHAACSGTDTIYVTDGNTLWRIGTAVEAVCDFIEQGYVIETINSMSVVDETVYLLTQVDGEYCFLTLSEEERPRDKQEITLSSLPFIYLKELVARFNRRSDTYHITMISPENGESNQDYHQRIQMELVAEKGPDLFVMFERDATGYARNGYLKDMEDILSKEENIWQVAKDNAKIDGIQYGIPYRMSLWMDVYSKEITGNRSTWTMEEMMEAVQESDAELLTDSEEAYGSVVRYILNDRTNTHYIDWSCMKSHLKEEPFLRVMKFAKKYLRTTQQYSRDIDFSDYGPALKKGIIASVNSSVDPCTLNFYYRVFNGKPAFIGQPKSDGGSVYVYTSNLYVSSTTDKEEGIQEFISYLLSEATQLQDSKNGTAQMPVRMDVMDEFLEYCREPGRTIIVSGVNYVEKGLTDEQIELYKEFFERAEPEPDSDDELYDIMCEELVPYLDGYRTLEEVADIMDNRVQLYLNERK